MSVLVGKKAPIFKASAVLNGGTVESNFSLDQFIGKKHVLFLTKNTLNSDLWLLLLDYRAVLGPLRNDTCG